MKKRVALLGDKTSSGGVIISGSGQAFCESDPLALLGDKVSCPSCKETGTIIQGAHHFIINGKPVAYDGCLVACGCPNNRIIALKSTMFLDDLTDESTSAVKNIINGKYSRLFSLVDSLKKKPLSNIAYGIKTKNGLIEGVSDDDGVTQSLNTEQQERIQVSYLFQTKIGI